MRRRGVKAGASAAMMKITSGLIMSLFWVILRNANIFDASYFWLIDTIGLVMMAVFVFSMFKWGLAYTAGWMLGAYLILATGITGAWNIFVYIAAPAAIWAIRILYAMGKRI